MNHKKMLEDIDNLVGTDFVEDMHFRAFRPKARVKFSNEEIKKMIQILVDVYRIAHSVHCKSCGVEYKKRNEKEK